MGGKDWGRECTERKKAGKGIISVGTTEWMLKEGGKYQQGVYNTDKQDTTTTISKRSIIHNPSQFVMTKIIFIAALWSKNYNLLYFPE